MMSLNHDYIKLYFMYCLATCMSSINKLMCCFRQVINSDTGPGSTMAEAIWHSSDTTNEATLLWQDPDLQNWQHYTTAICFPCDIVAVIDETCF